MTKYVDLRVTEKQFKIIFDFISREGSFIDSGDNNFDLQVKRLDKKLFRIKEEYGL